MDTSRSDSVLTNQNKWKNKKIFKFFIKEIEKEICSLKTNKTSQSSEIPTKIAKENNDIFPYLFCSSISNCFNFANFYHA